MTTHYRTKGFVFKKDDRSEADRIFTVFTEDFGKIEIRARAVRKIVSKLRGGIDTFYLSEVEFIQGKNYKTLTDAEALEKFSSISQNPEKLIIFNRIAEVLDGFIKGEEKDGGIFNLINETFIKLNNHRLQTTNYQLLYYYFFWNFFSELGYMPEIQKCAKCREKLNPYSLYFSNKEGGTICKQCAIKDYDKKIYPKDCQKINSDIVKILRLIFKKDWQVISRLKIDLFSQNLLSQISDNYHLYMLSSHSFS